MDSAPSNLSLTDKGRAATPISFVHSILLAYRKYGADPADALEKTEITDSMLKDPHSRVTASQLELLCSIAMQELDDEALGWFSRKLPWGSYGMLCRASLTSPNLGIALKRWCRHHRLLTDDIKLSLEISPNIARLVITSATLGEMQEFCLVSCLRYILGYACWVVDSRIPLLEANFPFPAPPHHEAYPLMFLGNIHFDSESAGFCFDPRYLDLPIRRDERALQLMLQRALPLTVFQYRRDRLLIQGVHQFLSEKLDTAATAESVAEHLHISVRTLHRQLKEEGTCLQQIKNQIRRDYSIELLTRSNRTIKQVANLVGFADEKSFIRAFNQWTGQSPGAFSQKILRTK